MTEPTVVVVIDDSATIRKLVEMSMRGTGYQPHFSASGSDGIALVRQVRPSAILLDCVLPDSSGQQVCRSLASDALTRTIPILLVSAKADSVRDEFREFANVVDFVTKPFTGPDLLRRIRRAVAGTTARFDRGQYERAAQIIYARLRDNLALMPGLVSQAGTSPMGPFLAKRLLTREAVAGILDDLSELYDEAHADDAPIEVEPVHAAAILDRAPGFSTRIRNVTLGSTARRVLTLVNGQHTLDEIACRLGLDTRSVGVVVRDLVHRGLLEDKTASSHTRPIVILEPDVRGFQQPLASLLESRPEAPALVAVSSLDEVIGTARRVHPSVVVVNATAEVAITGDAARVLRSDAALADVALVALLDRGEQSDRDELYSAGFDAVLSKPIIIGELERFLPPLRTTARKDGPWIRS